MSSAYIQLGGMFGGSGDTQILIDGEDVTKYVRSFTLHASVEDVTTLVLERLCLDGVEVEGAVQVLHYCGLEK